MANDVFAVIIQINFGALQKSKYSRKVSLARTYYRRKFSAVEKAE